MSRDRNDQTTCSVNSLTDRAHHLQHGAQATTTAAIRRAQVAHNLINRRHVRGPRAVSAKGLLKEPGRHRCLRRAAGRAAGVSEEGLLGYVIVPHLDSYRDVLKVLDARERSLQTIKTYLASMCFIRGSIASNALVGSARDPRMAVLRRGRAKLARLLARYRAHTTLVVELIQKWRQRYGIPLGGAPAEEEEAPATALVSNIMFKTDAPKPPPLQVERSGSFGAAGQPQSPTTKILGPSRSPQKRHRQQERKNFQRKPATVSSAMASAMAVAATSDSVPTAPRLVPKTEVTATEPFMWMGVNYLIKITQDMKYAPLPIESDPLLMSWFHYDQDEPTRREAFFKPLQNAWFLDPEKSAKRSDSDRIFAEQEWWFDPERLHTPEDIARMRAAEKVVLDEVTFIYGREGQRAAAKAAENGGGGGGDPAAGKPQWAKVNHQVLNPPHNDIGREMEVLLYSGAGGFSIKINSMETLVSKTVQIQCLYGSFALIMRVKRRRAARELCAALYIQRTYKRRLKAFLSEGANKMANAAAFARKDYLKQSEEKAKMEMREREYRERRERRGHTMRRRWVAVMSSVKEIKLRTKAATKMQCLFRCHQAQMTLFQRAIARKNSIRDMNSNEYLPIAMTIQAQFRAHKAATALLVDHYDQRVQWYDDSRTAVMIAPIAKHITAKRTELQLTLAGLRPRLTELQDTTSKQMDTLKQLWTVEGEVELLETVQTHLSIDVLMKRRLELKLGLSMASRSLERSEASYALVKDAHIELAHETHKVRGSLEVMERLQLLSETVTVITAGQTEALRRKLNYLELKLDQSHKSLASVRDNYHQALRKERESNTCVALASSLISRHGAAASAASVVDGSSEQPKPQDVLKAAVESQLEEKTRERDRVAKQCAIFEKLLKSQQAVQIVCHWAEGGLVTLRSLHASTFRHKLNRLERRRSEALGHCIATANAKIAYRICKQSMAELHGANELVADLKAQHASAPRATLNVVCTLPASCRNDSEACIRVLEDIATWMGVSDATVSYRSHEVIPEDGGQKIALHISASMCAPPLRI